MSQLMTIKLSKSPGASWGFRLQGGKDFATPLCIQKVGAGSIAANAGVQAGDAIVSINNHDALGFKHKEAQDAIMRAGNHFDLVIQRGYQTWRPNVTALPEVKTMPDGVPVATKTSLAANKKPMKPIGSGHNTSAAPFGQLNGSQIVNAQFNSPINIYSEDNIAATLSAQAEVLSKGAGKSVLGVNFMKNERAFDAKQSDVLRMVQEFDSDPQPEPQGTIPTTPPAGPPPGENICAQCERLIVGVFVRIKNKNLHAECFTCATCGSSLKNVGYYNVNEKLYCDIHAKQAARQNPPAPNLEPVTVLPGAPRPSGAMTSSQALFGPKAPAAAPSSPAKFSPVSSPKVVQSGPAPFKPPSGGVRVMPAPPCAPFKPVSAPAPSIQPPAPAPISFNAPAPVAAPKPAPQNFGAPSGDYNVRSHIPRKGAGMPFAPAPVAAAPSFPAPLFDLPKPAAPPITVGFLRGAQAPGQRTAPRRGRGVINQASAARIPMCASCQRQIRGPFVSALGKTWCPDHFICATSNCKRQLIDVGFVEEQGGLYCENCYERYLAPICGKCDKRVKGDCLNAIGKQFHPECFCCAYCGKVFGSGAFYLEDGLPYCETDWNDLFTTKCVGCNFPIEAGDRWVEALNNNYHSQCFKCSKCNKNLEGQSFFAKGGKPFCKSHAQRGI